MNGATVAPKHWAALAVLVTTTLMMRQQPQEPMPQAANNDAVWIRGFAVGVLHRVSREAAVVFDRTCAMAALAEYRARRRDHEAEWCGVRHEYPPLRPIRISKACLENPLAKDCM